MAVPVEGFTVLAKWEVLEPLLTAKAFEVPNGTALNDGHLWRCCFMAQEDALGFLKKIEALGLNVARGPDPDVVVMDEFDASVSPYCEWIQSAKWEKALIAWRRGTNPQTVSAREGWDPKKGSGLIHHRSGDRTRLTFLRIEGNVEVYFGEELQKEVYIGRTSPSAEALYKSATDVLQRYAISAQGVLVGDAAVKVGQAVESLRMAVELSPQWWNAYWFIGKGLSSLGNHAAAYEAFSRAYSIEKNVTAIPKEFAGVCLELGKFEEAVALSEACAALVPDDHEVLGNLAISYLMAGRIGEASRTIEYAQKLNAADPINRKIGKLVSEVVAGKRPQPSSLADLQKPIAKPRKPFWKLW